MYEFTLPRLTSNSLLHVNCWSTSACQWMDQTTFLIGS